MSGKMNTILDPKTCKTCGAVVTNLKRHMVQHGGTLECGKCGETFDSVRKKTEHMIAEHGRSLAYPCPFCNKTNGSKTTLNTHAWSAHGEFMLIFMVCFLI